MLDPARHRLARMIHDHFAVGVAASPAVMRDGRRFLRGAGADQEAARGATTWSAPRAAALAGTPDTAVDRGTTGPASTARRTPEARRGQYQRLCHRPADTALR